MAVVGDAYILVRAITNNVRDDIRNGLRGLDGEFDRAGQDSGKRFSDGFNRGSGRGGGLFSSLSREAEAAREKLNSLITTGYAVGPAIAALAGTIGAAVSGLFALASQAAAAGPALFSLVNVFTAVAQGAAVFKMAVSGVGAALSAGLNQTGGGGGKSPAQRAKEIEAAEKRVTAAEKRLAQVKQANAKREEAAGEAQEEARAREIEAYEEIAKYEQAEVEASNAVADAKSKIADAVDEAVESLQQLRFQLEEAVLSEQRAVLGFEDAREQLAKVSNLPPNNRQRREAELAFAEADLRLRRAKDATSDTAKAVDKANAKGIEGSDQVVAAVDRVTRAEKAYAKAQDDTKNAKNRATEATKAREKAEREYNAVLAENALREAEAQEALKEAKDNLNDVKNGTNDAVGGVDKFGQAMDKLSPSAQKFVEMIIGMKGPFSDLKKEVQEEFFSAINDDVKELADTYLPLLQKRLPETAAVLGTFGEKIIGVFNDPKNVGIIDRIFGSNNKILDDLGTAVTNLASSFLILLDAAAPLAEELAEWVKNITGGWKESLEADSQTGKLTKTFEYAQKVAKDLKDIFADLIGTIKNIGVAAAGPGSGGEMLLTWVKEAVAKWKEFTGSSEGQSRLETFFKNVAPVAKEILKVLGNIGKAIFETTEAGVAPGAGGEKSPLLQFFESINSAIEKFTSVGPGLTSTLPTIGGAIDSIAGALANLTSSGAIDKFFEVIKGAADFFAGLTSNPVFLQIFAVVAPIFAISRGLSLIYGVAKLLFLGSIVGNLVKFTGFFDKIRELASGKVATFLATKLPFLAKPIAALAGISGSAVAGPILLVVAAIAGLVAIFVALWNESEIFRKALQDLVSNVMEKAKKIFEELKKKVEDALAPLGGTAGVIDKLKQAFKFLGDIIGTYIIPIIEDQLMVVLDVLGAIIGTVIDTIGNVIESVVGIIDAFKAGDIKGIVENFFGLMTAPIRAFLDNILGLFDTSIGEWWDKFTGVWSDIFDFFKELPGKIAEKVSGLWDSLVDTLKATWDDLWSWFNPIDGKLAVELRKLPQTVRDAVSGLWNAFLDFLKERWNATTSFVADTIMGFIKLLPMDVQRNIAGLWDAIRDFINDPWNSLTNFFTVTVITWIKGLPERFRSALSGLWDALPDGLKSAWRAVATWWNNNVALTWTIDVPDFLPGPDTVSVTIPPLPTAFAMGGVVYPQSGGVLATIAEAGRPERIEPLDPDGLSKRDKAMINFLTGGGGGTTINVYPSEGMNERELAQMVSRELASMTRRGAI